MNRLAHPFRLAIAAAMLAICCGGCDAPPIKPVLTDPDPSVKIPAIKLAVQQKDRAAIPNLIQSLESDDPAIRFYANDALIKLTGQDFGFLYYADDPLRRAAVQRWQAWLATSAGQAASKSTANSAASSSTQP
jgi:hypothetical protein